jgi:hypothetical protein
LGLAGNVTAWENEKFVKNFNQKNLKGKYHVGDLATYGNAVLKLS